MVFEVAEAHVAFYMPVFPDVADGERKHNWCCAFGLDFGDVLAHIPAESVHHLLVSSGHGEFLRLFAKARKRSARAVLIDRAAIVVAPLDEHEIAGLQVILNLVPQSFGLEGPAAAAGAGAVDHVDLRQVEVIGERVRPAAVVDVAGGGIADDEDGGQLRVDVDGRRLLGQGGPQSNHRGG